MAELSQEELSGMFGVDVDQASPIEKGVKNLLDKLNDFKEALFTRESILETITDFRGPSEIQFARQAIVVDKWYQDIVDTCKSPVLKKKHKFAYTDQFAAIFKLQISRNGRGRDDIKYIVREPGAMQSSGPPQMKSEVK